MAPTSRHAITVGALLPLVLTALVAAAAPASAATISMSIGASADGGDGAEQYLSHVAPAGAIAYHHALTAGPKTGDDGTARGSASQTTSIGAMGITATASGTVSTTPTNPDAMPNALPEATAGAGYEHEGWVVPASGKWRITLSLRNEGTPDKCAGTVSGYVRFSQISRTPPIAEKVLGCNDGAQDHVVLFTLKAGETLNLSADMSIWTRKGSQTASWTVKVEPVSVTPPAVKKAPQSTGAPRISGKAKVGKTLSATAGAWKNDPTTFAFQWLRKGKAISGATAPTYKVKKGDKGKKISVRVTASNSAGKGIATSKAVKIKKPKKAKKR